MSRPISCPECGKEIGWETDSGGMCGHCGILVEWDRQRNEISTLSGRQVGIVVDGKEYRTDEGSRKERRIARKLLRRETKKDEHL